MKQMRENDTKALRTPQEIDELNRLLEDKTIPEETAKRANVLIHMNIRDKADGTHVSYMERLQETLSAVNVCESFVKETLMLYNRAGMNGIMRINPITGEPLIDPMVGTDCAEVLIKLHVKHIVDDLTSSPMATGGICNLCSGHILLCVQIYEWLDRCFSPKNPSFDARKNDAAATNLQSYPPRIPMEVAKNNGWIRQRI